MSNLNAQRNKVFLDRYAKKGPDGQPVEALVEEMWGRVAKAIGNDDDERSKFYELLRDFKFVPGGRILAGAGAESEVTYYNCYVIPVETKARRTARVPGLPGEFVQFNDSGSDSREAIFDTIGLMVDIMSRGGGVGINWSVLRPKGAYLKRVNGTSSGPIGWMDVASKAVGEVEQGGSRRGAAMFMLDDWHPDLLDFINAKRDLTRITNANVSVAVSDLFMNAVLIDDDWAYRFPDTTHPAYNREWDGDLSAWYGKGYPVNVFPAGKARDIWRVLAGAAWESGEPGVVFLDRYNKKSTARGVERIISVNPCGEQGLGAYSVCNLGAMNLDAYFVPKVVTRDNNLKNGDWSEYDNGGPYFDWEAFGKDVATATRFLDNVIDKNHYFIPENERAQKDLRRIGLGVMGLADVLLALGYRYGSPEAVEFTEAVFRQMKDTAIVASNLLAEEKGAAPAWDESMLDRPYLAEFFLRRRRDRGFLKEHGLRNLFLLTQAPTGTTSILAGVNSGIEPYFAFKYTRVDRTGEHVVLASAVEKYRDPAIDYGANSEWVTASDVTVEEHIAMQAAVQKYVDSSVSKTINGPNSHTLEDVEKAFTLAYESGLKGLAYFRDGSGRAQVLYKDGVPEKANEELAQLKDENVSLRERLERALGENLDLLTEWERPESLTGQTVKVRTAAGTAYVTVNRDDKGLAREVFFHVGKAGSDVMELGEALGRLASLSLRKGASLGGVANQLEGVGGYSNFNSPLASALGKALSDINRGPKKPRPASSQVVEYEGKSVLIPAVSQKYVDSPVSSTADLCPECGSIALVREEGCSKCHVCGYAAC